MGVWPVFRGRLSLAIQTAVAHEIIKELGYADGVLNVWPAERCFCAPDDQ